MLKSVHDFSIPFQLLVEDDIELHQNTLENRLSHTG